MMNKKILAGLIVFTTIGVSSAVNAENSTFSGKKNTPAVLENKSSFNVELERFADIQVLRYQVPGFDELDPKKKELLYYLSQAAYSGRDIMYDQNFK
ncbi:dihydrofolate reductase, partial [bacterium AH-315-K03]|nr:dihydrofolate reductase [bacterium AH-315-K03]